MKLTPVVLKKEVQTPVAKPFLKWAGGKSQLVTEILNRFPIQFNRYFEPFLGGGAVFFALTPKKAILSDINQELVTTYQAIRDNVGFVVRELQKHKVDENYFYWVREKDPTKLNQAKIAARMIYLNRTCFNGLYRVNKRGRFNVPYGHYENPTVCNEENLLRVTDILTHTQIEHRHAFEIAKHARAGDLVYLDPPYQPLSKTSSFTSYTINGFTEQDQKDLANIFRWLAKKGVSVVLSNSDTPLIREIYKGFRVEEVYARRAINSKADRRGKVSELLICSK